MFKRSPYLGVWAEFKINDRWVSDRWGVSKEFPVKGQPGVTVSSFWPTPKAYGEPQFGTQVCRTGCCRNLTTIER